MELHEVSPSWRPLLEKIQATQQHLDYVNARDELIAEIARRPKLRAALRRKAGLPPLAA